jgi:hypothetical protein
MENKTRIVTSYMEIDRFGRVACGDMMITLDAMRESLRQGSVTHELECDESGLPKRLRLELRQSVAPDVVAVNVSVSMSGYDNKTGKLAPLDAGRVREAVNAFNSRDFAKYRRGGQ